MPQRFDQLARRFVPFSARAEAAIDDFLEMIAAWETTHVAAAHRARGVAAQHHRRDQPHLVDVVALLPAANSSPRDFRRHVEHVERVRGDATLTALVHRDAEVAQLELLVLADENVERREIAMQRLSAVQNVERLEDCGDLAPNEALRLSTFFFQPHAEVPMYRVLERDAVAGSPILDLGEPIVHPQRARLAEEQLGEVRLAEPARESFGDLDADLLGQSVTRCRRREIDFAESSLANQSIQLVGAATLGAERSLHAVRTLQESFSPSWDCH